MRFQNPLTWSGMISRSELGQRRNELGWRGSLFGWSVVCKPCRGVGSRRAPLWCVLLDNAFKSVSLRAHTRSTQTHTHTHTHPFTHLASPMSIPAMMEWFPPVCLLLGGKFHSTFNPPFLRGSLIDHAIRCTLCAGITLTVETVVYPSHHHPPPILP